MYVYMYICIAIYVYIYNIYMYVYIYTCIFSLLPKVARAQSLFIDVRLPIPPPCQQATPKLGERTSLIRTRVKK